MDAFERFGLPRESILHRVDRFEICRRGRRIPLDLSSTPLAIGDRPRFDRSIRRQALERGARIEEALFRSLEKRREGFRIHCRKGEERLAIRCRRLVAADGVLSPLRKAITGSPPPSLLSHYLESDAGETSPDTCRFRFGKEVAGNRYAWDFPCPRGRHMGTLAGPGHLENLLRYLGRPGGKVRGYRIPLYADPLFLREGVFFVGDAAGQVLPFTYEGIHYAVASAELLVRTQLETGDPESYAAAWRERFGEKFDTFRHLERLFLSHEITLTLLMRLFENPSFQSALSRVWLQDRSFPGGWELYAKLLGKLLHR
jgi:geranylgeranyl reductase